MARQKPRRAKPESSRRSKSKSRARTGTQRRAARPRRAAAAQRPDRPPLTIRRAALTIQFSSEQELQSRLEAMLSLFQFPVAVGRAAAPGARDSCLSLFPAIDVVSEALTPKNFLPSEKLGDTYLTSQERELFRARVVDRVESRGCQIDAEQVPGDEGKTHGDVVSAVRENARS